MSEVKKYKSVAHMVKDHNFDAIKNYFKANPKALESIKEVNEKGYRDIDKLLELSILNPNKDIVDYLIFHGADINVCDDNGTSLLMIAAQSNNVQSIHTLIEKGVDLHKIDETFKKAIHYAVMSNAVEAFDALFNTGEFSINDLVPVVNNSFLHIAAYSGSVEMTDRLIQLGVDPTLENSIEGALASECVPETNPDDENPDNGELTEKMNNLFEKIESYRNSFKKSNNSFDF